jgi:hypothetical protein
MLSSVAGGFPGGCQTNKILIRGAKIMKTYLRVTLIFCMAFAITNILPRSVGAQEQKSYSSGGSGISVNNINGQTMVTWNGERVFSGTTKGFVSARCNSVNGTQYAAAFDGDAVIWENVPGAAEKLRSDQGLPASSDFQKSMENLQKKIEEQKKFIEKRIEEQKKFLEQQQQYFQTQKDRFDFGNGFSSGNSFSFGNGSGSSFSSSNGVSVKTVNGETVVIYQGKEISIGKTKGKVSTKAKSVNGVSYAVVYDGDQIVWENIPDAAEQFK